MTDEQLFDRAIQLGRDDRDELLTDACQSTEQRARVEALLDAHGAGRQFAGHRGDGSRW